MHDPVTALARQVRVLRTLVRALGLALGCVVLLGFASGQDARRTASFDELTVGRLNVAGPDGVNRIVLAHEMPQAPFGGKMVERTVPPGLAGMIFCAPNGDEIGGIGASEEHSLLALDYRGVPLEAIGLVQRRANGQSAGLVVMENPTGPVDLDAVIEGDEDELRRFQAMMVNRVSLGVAEHTASLTLNDREGRPRIVIGVDAGNDAYVKILDEAGDEVLRLP